MKKQVFPLALGFIATIAAPAHAATDRHPVDLDYPVGEAASVMPVASSRAEESDHLAESGTAIAATVAETTAATDIAQTAMPVAQDPSLDREATGVLNFEPQRDISPPIAPATLPQQTTVNTAPRPESSPSKGAIATHPTEKLFAGGSQSLVARVVGSAEGTRNPDGSPTEIFQGHVDPGNGVWNRGTFSYQFGNEENLSTEEADRRQLAKIKRLYEAVMLSKAAQQGIDLTLAEELNGIDLINQAPLAVTEAGGYIERLAAAKAQKGLTGAEAILDARVWAFWDPQRNGWDAPGLRAYDDLGKEASIRHDQQRRMGMIDAALDAYQQQHGAIAANPVPDSSSLPLATQSTANPRISPEAVANAIIFQTANLSTNGSKFSS